MPFENDDERPLVPEIYRATQFRTPGTPHWPERFALVTGYATTGESWPAARNEQANRRLEEHLVLHGIWHWPVTGYAPATGHEEPGWAVGLDLDAVYWIEDDVLYVSFCDERRGRRWVAGSFAERVSYVSNSSA